MNKPLSRVEKVLVAFNIAFFLYVTYSVLEAVASLQK